MLHRTCADAHRALTITANLAGISGFVVPAPTPHPNGLPIGLQLIAPACAEMTLLRVGDAIMRF